jgi:xylulokinase
MCEMLAERTARRAKAGMAEDAPLFLGLDLSTQSLTALVVEQSGTVVARSSVNYDQELPHYKTSSGMHRAAEGGGERVTSPVLMWLEAFDMAIERVGRTGVLGRVVAVSASAQQHGSVYWKVGARQKLQALGASQLKLKDALAGCFACEDCPIWADSSTHEECAAMEAALGGAERLAAMTGTKYCKSSLDCAFTLQMYSAVTFSEFLPPGPGSRAYPRFTAQQFARMSRRHPDVWAACERVSLVSSFVSSILSGDYAAIDMVMKKK